MKLSDTHRYYPMIIPYTAPPIATDSTHYMYNVRTCQTVVTGIRPSTLAHLLSCATAIIMTTTIILSLAIYRTRTGVVVSIASYSKPSRKGGSVIIFVSIDCICPAIGRATGYIEYYSINQIIRRATVTISNGDL